MGVKCDFARPLDDKGVAGSHFKEMLLVAVDGSMLALQDTEANSKDFGRSSNQHGPSAWPLARFVLLAECGTNLVFGATLGGYKDSEHVLAVKLTPLLRPGMLCLADRLFPGYDAWGSFSQTGAHLLWRAKTGIKLEKVKELPDGSYLADWLPETSKGNGSEPHRIRVVEYRLKKEGEVYRLITTLLDPDCASAEELARIYPQRWEIELTIKENKVILRKGSVTLRSKTPELVRQEFWGMLLAHYMVRKIMVMAASSQGDDPDRLSYTGSLEIIKSTQAGSPLLFPPQTRKAALDAAVREVALARSGNSRGLSKPRSIKHRPKPQFPVRRPLERIKTTLGLSEVFIC